MSFHSFGGSAFDQNFPADSQLHVADDSGATFNGTLGSLGTPTMGCVNLCYPLLMVVVR